MNQPSTILLCTLNSTYQHSAFGLRYIYANMGPLVAQTKVCEWTIKENPRNIVESILKSRPKIVGFGVYIWNTNETLAVLKMIRKVAPEIIVVLGGPEISYETQTQEHCHYCDYIIQGEADFAFRDLCLRLITIQNAERPPMAQVIAATLPGVTEIVLPYYLYTDDDIKNRVIYVEASRGCPYKCEYCLSSLDKSVRNFPLDSFLEEMNRLLKRGARVFKFVDRTFNLSPTTSTKILSFFLEHIHLGLFLHFELVPDRLPPEIRHLIQKFPIGSLQFEVGIQTLNPVVAANVSRKNDLIKVAENFKFIKENTSVHTHADLIVGLPAETLQSFADGFDQLESLGPDEIQVGLLKRLKGTPIARHEKTYAMKYSDFAPYQILQTSAMDFLTMQKMNRFAKFWDLYANSGEFKNFMTWIRQQPPSVFWSFYNFCEYLEQYFSETHSISLINLAEKAWSYMLARKEDLEEASRILTLDYSHGAKRRDLPGFLKTNQIKIENHKLDSRQKRQQAWQAKPSI